MRRLTLTLALLVAALPLSSEQRKIRHRRPVAMEATAYAQHGVTKSGAHTRRGIIAADPRVLPIGTKVKVENAGAHSGNYVVKDTGRKIKGRKIDIFMPSRREAKQFGRKDVKVRVLQPAPKQ